jgi:KipI family sensor histidine kinase inhibitor
VNEGSIRIREAGDSAVLLQYDPVIDASVNARVIAIADVMRAQRIGGVRDVVSTFSGVAVYFDPLLVAIDTVTEALRSAANVAVERASNGRVVEVPVSYGGEAGPDMSELATMTGLTETEIARRHAELTYRVFMLGFLPGFAYMASVDESIAAPRRTSPRVRVPAGSVGIAGRQTGIYPLESPGGWQIIGRTPLRVFDPVRAEPCLFEPGDSVRFVDAGPSDPSRLKAAPTSTQSPVGSAFRRTLTVITPGLFTTVQDEGRWGRQGSGISVSGALDLTSHRLANAVVGNDRTAATLEITLQGPELRFDRDAVIAVAGADLSPTLDGASLRQMSATRGRAGSVLRFGDRRSGARAYLALSGGIDVAPVLGSRSTHAMTAVGGVAGRQLRAGDVLELGESASSTRSPVIAVEPRPRAVRLRAVPGPQDDFFAPTAFEILQRAQFRVSPQSNRMGYRLTGEAIPRSTDREMISDATFLGGLQIPPSGEPILLMADRQTTGGYPQIATVITADLPVAAQLAPGDSVEFELCSRPDAISALVAQEARLLASI